MKRKNKWKAERGDNGNIHRYGWNFFFLKFSNKNTSRPSFENLMYFNVYHSNKSNSLSLPFLYYPTFFCEDKFDKLIVETFETTNIKQRTKVREQEMLKSKEL